jgi:hypothetical protein
MSEERRLKINLIRNNLERLLTSTEAFEEHIKELIEFNDPEGRDLSIAMTTLEQALSHLIELNLRIVGVTRAIVPPPDPMEPQLVTWTRQLQPLRPMNQDPLDHIPFFTWGQPAGDNPFEHLRPVDIPQEEETVMVVQEPRHNHAQAPDKEYEDDSLFGSEYNSE